MADLDHDGRLEVILKNRNAPQLRVLRNAMKDIGHSIAFRLRGQKSNRDAIGAAVTVEAGPLRQTKYLQAGSGFLSQHTKELFFGLGKGEGPVRATVRWPSGLEIFCLAERSSFDGDRGPDGITTAFLSTQAEGDGVANVFHRVAQDPRLARCGF